MFTFKHLTAWLAILALGTPMYAGDVFGPDFTYQGELRENGVPVNGTFNMVFRLFDSAVGGSQILNDEFEIASVNNGLFTVVLDFFLPPFNGQELWLEIEVEGEILSPRHHLTPTPYAVFSRGVRGLTISSEEAVAVGTTFTTYQFQSFTDDRTRAIYGNNTNPSGTTYGVYGRASGSGGYGVYGLHDASSGTAAGVYGETDSTSANAVGVHGVVDTTSAGNFSAAVRGENMGTGNSGIGVWGSHDGGGWGVYGTSAGGFGRGVFGEITGSGGTAGWFSADSGVAVFANGIDNNGSTAALTVTTGDNTMLIDGNEIDSTSSGGLFLNNNNSNNVVLANGGGYVIIGSTTPDVLATLSITEDVRAPISLKRSNVLGGLAINFRDENDLQAGSIIITSGGSVSYNSFTGSHRAWHDGELAIGELIRMTGDNRWERERGQGEIIYGVKPTTRANDPAVLGAYIGRELSSTDPAIEEHVPHLVASVGNGDMWVTDDGRGDIAPGDLLISSDVPGCAMKDDPARFQQGYVVARAADRVDWALVEPDEYGVRRVLISVLFDPFVRTALTDNVAMEALRDEVKQLRSLVEAMRTDQSN